MIKAPSFDKAPFLVIWETTRACDLSCVHCRAEAIPEPDPHELGSEEGRKLIRDVKEMGTPILIFSGGDPLKRPELYAWIQYAKSLGLRTGVIPAVTPLLTEERILKLKEAGADQIAFSLDAADAQTHDSFRRVSGVFERTVAAIRYARSIGLPVQINSLVNVHNTSHLDDLIVLIETFGIVFWEVFFLVPTGRGKDVSLLSAEKFEQAFEKLHELSKRVQFVLKVTEAPHYRRYVLQHADAGGKAVPAELKRVEGPGGSIGHAPLGVNSGKGFLFVSHEGNIYPSGFLPLSAGSVRTESLAVVYREHPLFKQLRDVSLLKGRCSVCEYREVCGGSRARAYAMTGDYLAEDPCCSYQPVGGEKI